MKKLQATRVIKAKTNNQGKSIIQANRGSSQ